MFSMKILVSVGAKKLVTNCWNMDHGQDPTGLFFLLLTLPDKYMWDVRGDAKRSANIDLHEFVIFFNRIISSPPQPSS